MVRPEKLFPAVASVALALQFTSTSADATSLRHEGRALRPTPSYVYVADGSTDKLYKYPAAAGNTPIWSISLPASSVPYPVAVNPNNGNVYVAMQASSLVDIYNSSGTLVGQLTAANGIHFPFDLAFGANGTLYVTITNPTTGTGEVAVYPASSSSTGPSLLIPAPVADRAWYGVTVDSSNNVYTMLGLTLGGQIYEFAPGSTTGTVIVDGPPDVIGGLAVLPSGVLAESFYTAVQEYVPPSYSDGTYYNYGTGNTTGWISTGSDGSLVVPVKGTGVYVYPAIAAPYTITGLADATGAALGP
jgi:hypothetical protein